MNFCRACMCEISSKLQPLFNTHNVPDLFQSLTNLKISRNDGLPSKICLDCIEKLRQYNVFKIQCIRSHTFFKFKLKSNKSTKKDHPKTNSVLDLDSIKFESIKLETIQNIKIEADENDKNEFSDEKLITTQHCDSEDIRSEPECILKEYKSTDDEGITDDKNFNNSNKVGIEENAGEVVDKNVIITKSPAVTVLKKVQRFPKRIILKKLEKVEYKKKEPEKFPFTCTICNRGFSYQERYEGHLREHEGKRAAVCEICGNEYTEWSNLLKHMRREHKDDMKYKCDCGKIFMYESGLIAHKLTHSGQRSTKLYVCENCGKSFKDSYALKKHSVVHKSETPFACDECAKQFKSEYRLRRHQFRHKNIRKFICTICGKSFITRPELRVHVQSHSSESKFDCKLCGKMFRQKSQVTMHMRTHEGL